MGRFKFETGDPVVFTPQQSYWSGIRYAVTARYFQMKDPRDPSLDTLSYDIRSPQGPWAIRKREDELYLIPVWVEDRLKEK